MNIALLLAALFIALFSLQVGIQNSNSARTIPVKTFQNEATSSAIVIKIVDGDTIKINTGKTIRLIGIDTPELHHPKKAVGCFAKEAAEESKKLLFGKSIRLEKDISETDKYGRLLRYVYIGEQMINEKLVEEGYAKAASFPPDIKYQDRFLKAERVAKEKNAGLWNNCSF